MQRRQWLGSSDSLSIFGIFPSHTNRILDIQNCLVIKLFLARVKSSGAYHVIVFVQLLVNLISLSLNRKRN